MFDFCFMVVSYIGGIARLLLKDMEIFLHQYDIPSDFEDGGCVAVDTETMGLRPYRDRLCLLQLSSGDRNCHLVQFHNRFDKSPNLKLLLQNRNIKKIFHYARFDVMMIYKSFGIEVNNIYCTKIASKLVRTFTDKHSLLDLCRDLLGIEISKEQTQTDWGSESLSDAQMLYAATDVLYLHQLRQKLDMMLERENRVELAESCFNFVVSRVKLDLMCGEDYDIFAHH